jgi:hypothetical protein
LPAAELAAAELVPVREPPRPDGVIGGRQSAGHGEQQREDVLGDGLDVGLRGVGDDHAVRGRGVHRDVVDADPVPRDHAQGRRPGDVARGDRAVADQDSLHRSEDVLQLDGVPSETDQDLAVLGEQGETLLVHRMRHVHDGRLHRAPPHLPGIGRVRRCRIMLGADRRWTGICDWGHIRCLGHGISHIVAGRG